MVDNDASPTATAGKLPVEWTAWLAGSRREPPSASDVRRTEEKVGEFEKKIDKLATSGDKEAAKISGHAEAQIPLKKPAESKQEQHASEPKPLFPKPEYKIDNKPNEWSPDRPVV